MARIPRLYEVKATYRNGEVALRHYQTPEAAEERRARFLEGRPQVLSASHAADYAASGEEPPRDIPEVTVTPSHPITYPRGGTDAATLDIPDGTVPGWVITEMLQELGVMPEHFQTLTIEGNQVRVELDGGEGKPPKSWRVEIT